jgi:hypothetical protein
VAEERVVTRFVLPKTAQAHNWVRSTDAFRAHLHQRLASVKIRADQKRKEADEIERESTQIEQAIALLDQLLPPKPGALQVASKPIESVAPVSRWSMMYDSCQKCHRTSAKHMARGLCGTCYRAEAEGRVPTVANGVVDG